MIEARLKIKKRRTVSMEFEQRGDMTYYCSWNQNYRIFLIKKNSNRKIVFKGLPISF